MKTYSSHILCLSSFKATSYYNGKFNAMKHDYLVVFLILFNIHLAPCIGVASSFPA